MANPDLTWETSEQLDFGIDARFLSNRLSFGLDWYRKVTKDLLVNISPLPELGFKSATVNSGEVLNTGFDIEVGWRDNIGDLKYSIMTNFSTLKNEVQKVNDMLPRYSEVGISGFNSTLSPTFEAGHPIWYFRGYEYAGVNPETGRPQYYSKKTDEATGEKVRGIVEAPDKEDLTDLGSAIPTFTYGITLNLEYKGLRLYCIRNWCIRQ